MINSLLQGVLFAQFLPFSDGFSFQEIFLQWEAIGVFDFFLPFLLIFAVIFGILNSTGILSENKGVHVIVALVIALISIRFVLVTEFLNVLFANLGIGIAVLIVLLIMVGILIPNQRVDATFKIFVIVAMVISAIIAVVTLNQFAWFGSFWWQENWLNILWLLLIGLGIYLLMNSGGKGSDKKDSVDFGPFRVSRNNS